MIAQHEKIDMDLLETEILSKPADASMPSNLSDYWLEALSFAFDACLTGDDGGMQIHLAAPMALIAHIVTAQKGGEVQVSPDEMYTFFQDYRIELSLEEVSRKTDIKCAPATLNTIFTDRNVGVSSREL